MAKSKTSFKKGQNGGAKGGAKPGAGRPPEWLKEKCREHAPNLIEFLVSVASGKDVEQVITENGETVKVPAAVRERIKASEIILDRGYGKPTQELEHSGEISMPYSIVINQVDK